jgi:hypothetical protein
MVVLEMQNQSWGVFIPPVSAFFFQCSGWNPGPPALQAFRI